MHSHCRMQALSLRSLSLLLPACCMLQDCTSTQSLRNGQPCCLHMDCDADLFAQVAQPNEEQAAVTAEPVQPTAAAVVQPATVVAEPVQPATVEVQPLVATDAAAAAAVVDAAAAVNEAVSTAAAAQIGAIAASISADSQAAAAALGGAVAAAAADGALATAGMSGIFISYHHDALIPADTCAVSAATFVPVMSLGATAWAVELCMAAQHCLWRYPRRQYLSPGRIMSRRRCGSGLRKSARRQQRVSERPSRRLCRPIATGLYFITKRPGPVLATLTAVTLRVLR